MAKPALQEKFEQRPKAISGASGLDAVRNRSDVVQPAGNQAALAVDEAERKRWNEAMGWGRPAVGSTLDLLRRATKRVSIELTSAKELRNTQEEINDDQEIVSTISAGVGSVWSAFQGKGLHGLAIPNYRIWDKSDSLLSEVRSQIATGDIIRAAHALQNFVNEYVKARTELNEYLERVSLGTGISITGLEAVRAIGAIAATIASGGIAAGAAVPMLGITAGTGLGLLGTSAAIGVGAGTYGLAQEESTQIGEIFAGTRADLDLQAIAMRGGRDAILGFAGAFTGGALSKFAIGYFGRFARSRMTPDQIAVVAEKLGVEATLLTPQVFLSRGQRLLIDFLAGTATTPLTSAVEIIWQQFEGKGLPSWEVFGKMVMDNAIQGGLLQLFLAAITHRSAGHLESDPNIPEQVVEPVPASKSRAPVEPTTIPQNTTEPARPQLNSAAELSVPMPSETPKVIAEGPKNFDNVNSLPAKQQIGFRVFKPAASSDATPIPQSTNVRKPLQASSSVTLKDVPPADALDFLAKQKETPPKSTRLQIQLGIPQADQRSPPSAELGMSLSSRERGSTNRWPGIESPAPEVRTDIQSVNEFLLPPQAPARKTIGPKKPGTDLLGSDPNLLGSGSPRWAETGKLSRVEELLQIEKYTAEKYKAKGANSRETYVEPDLDNQALVGDAEEFVALTESPSINPTALKKLSRAGTDRSQMLKEIIVPKLRKQGLEGKIFSEGDYAALEARLNIDKVPWQRGDGPDILLVDLTSKPPRVWSLDLTRSESAAHFVEKKIQMEALEKILPSGWDVKHLADFHVKVKINSDVVLTRKLGNGMTVEQVLQEFGFGRGG